MKRSLLNKLQKWRDDTARKEGVESYRVLSNNTLEEIVEVKPTTDVELLKIKGIKEKKCTRYGNDIIAIVTGVDDVTTENTIRNDSLFSSGKDRHYSVGEYLDILNECIAENARVVGEVSSIDFKDNYLFFTMKDKQDGSMLKCFMWARDYKMCGVNIEEGLEIIAGGVPEIYKPTGNLTFRARGVELVGEGALKKAYEKLKIKLSREGLFAPERKRSIPEFPERIGLITSATGAVIHDFQSNLGHYGYHVEFFNSRVEGQSAARDLLVGITYFQDKDVDVIVIIRGGGSIESLQAFNNEMVVRAITASTAPVMCGIGHDKDIPLASLAADVAVSTPTAAAVLLGRGWEGALNDLRVFEREMISAFERVLDLHRGRIERSAAIIKELLGGIVKTVDRFYYDLETALANIKYNLEYIKRSVLENSVRLVHEWSGMLRRAGDRVTTAEKVISSVDPKRQLKLGYSIVSKKEGGIISSVRDVAVGGNIVIQVVDGTIDSRVEAIKII